MATTHNRPHPRPPLDFKVVDVCLEGEDPNSRTLVQSLLDMIEKATPEDEARWVQNAKSAGGNFVQPEGSKLRLPLDELRALCVKYSGSSFTRLANKVADLVVRCDSTGGGDMQAEAAVSYGSTDSTQLNPIRHHRQLSLKPAHLPPVGEVDDRRCARI